MIETKIIVKPKGNSGTGNGSGASGYGGEYVSEADYAARAGKAKKAESADLAMRANTANTADRAKYADKAGELDEEAEVLKRYIRKDIDDIAQGTVTWEKVQKLLSGLLIGNSNNENGGSWTPDAEGRSHLITDYLEVRMKAIFEELVINKTSTIGGKEIISPTGGVVAHKVEEVTVTYNNVSQKAYRCYFLAEQDGDEVDNDFAVNDQVRSESFNVRKGTYHKAGNHFYWRLVIGRDEDPVELEGKKYHYIDLSDTDCATASDVPAKGDVLNQCGNRTDVERQNCLIFSAVDTYSPSISLYHGINSYSFANREYVEYGVNKQNNKAFFNVYGDMYVGDRPTKENGYEGSSYIRYDSSTKQLSVKGKISAKSTVDGKELSQYIKENTDDTIANAAKKAAEDAQKAAQTAQTDITNLGKTVTGNKKEFDNYVTDGYLEPSEIAAMAQDSKRLEDDFAAAQKSYNEVKKAEVLTNTKELTDLDIAFTTLTTAKKELIKYLSDISARYNAADTNYKATIVSAVGTKFTNFQSAYSAFYDKLGLANAYITSKIYGDLKQNITDLAGYKYLKDALGQTTDIDGGLVMTTLLALRDGDGNVQSGINGAIDPNRGQKSIATWWGGQMVDKDYNNGNLTPATSLIRFDGSGYLANGAIWWDVSGKVHADPTSFIISEKNLGAYLIFFEPTWKEGSAGTSVADLVSLKPNAPFSKLGVSGDATFEGAISFHGIKITYDATNKAIKIDGNLYATGGITAYGAGASTTGGGGGLNGSVKSYSNALKLTSESLSEIASAYSIKALDSRISSLEGGSAMDVSVSGSGNAVTAISKSGTTISVTKGTTFLTSHQSLASYLTRTDAASLYQPKGNYLTSHQSLADYAKKTEIPTTLPANGGNSDTVDNEHASNFSYTHQSSFDFSKIKSGRIVTFDQSNTDYGWINGFASTHADYLTSVIFNTHRTSNWYVGYIEADKSTGLTNGLSAVRQLAFLDSKVADSDKLDGIHANELFTNLSNSNNGISVTIGGTTKSVSNISVNHASNADTALKVYGQVADTGFHELVRCDMNSDKFRIIAGSSGSNNGWAEIATADDGNEPIYVRQYSGVFSSVVRTLTLLDANGYTHFPSYINIGGNENNNSSPDRVWGSNSSDSYLRSYRTSALSVANADTVDGVHASGLLTDVSNSNNGVSITVGGTTKSISNISVNYASSAGNADTVDGYHENSFIHWLGTKPFKEFATIYSGGIYNMAGNPNGIDGLVSSSWNQTVFNVSNYSATRQKQLIFCYDRDLIFYRRRTDEGWTPKRIIAFIDSNVASATKLQTPRTIWGQSFDGTGNVDGTLRIKDTTSNYREGIRIQNPDNTWCTIALGGTSNEGTGTNCWSIHRKSDNNFCISRNSSDGANGLVMTSTGMGLGTTAPAYRLDVRGDIYSSDRVIANNSVLSNKLYSSTTPNNTENKCIEIAGNTIREYHSGANPYHSDIILNYDSLSFSAYGTIDITANQGGITLDTGGSIELSSAGGFNITYRGAHFSVSQTNGSEYTWSMDSIKAKGNILATGGITAYSSSDIRLKQDLRKLDYLGIIKAMGGTFGFAWKKDNTRSIGWIAQHVLCNPHLKDIVETDEKGYYKINYWSPKLIATAFGAIEQVGDEVSRLKARVVFLESEVQRLSGDKKDCNKKRLDNKNINSLN